MSESTADKPAAAAAASTLPPVPEVPDNAAHEASLLATFMDAPSVNRAVLRPAPGGHLTLQAFMTQRNLPANNQRKYTVSASLIMPPRPDQAGQTAQEPLVVSCLPMELSDALVVSTSPSGTQQLVVRAGPDGCSALMQVWRAGRVVLELAVPKALHGPLVVDGYFSAGGVSWSPDEDAVAYVAESVAAERTPAWGGPESLKDAAGPRSWRGQGAALEDWGELNTGKRDPLVAVLDIKAGAVIRVTGLPADHSIGQPTWAPSTSTSTSASTTSTATAATATAASATASPTSSCSSGLLVVAWPNAATNFGGEIPLGRKLGVVFCYNRPAHLYHVPLTRGNDGSGALSVSGTAVRLAPSLGSCLSPTFSPGGTRLVLLSHGTAVQDGTHSATGRLYQLPWPAALQDPAGSTPQVVVDVVDVPQSDESFPGLYANSLPDDPFLDEDTLLINTQWRSQGTIVAIDLSASSSSAAAASSVRPVTPLAPPAAAGAAALAPGALGSKACSWSLTAVCRSAGVVLATKVSPTCPQTLMLGRMPAGQPASAAVASITWSPIDLWLDAGSTAGSSTGSAVQLSQLLSDMAYTVMRVDVPASGGAAGTEPIECIVFYPKERAGPCPTIVAPHGGPHTAVPLGWFPAYAFFAAMGYAVLLPNYRGSTGYGQAALASLPGRIGVQDVADCVACLDAAVGAGLTDPERVSIIGGSHGGFLTGHLLGQHPNMFKAGVMRNPVTNIALMVGLTDILDWCFVEVFGSKEGKRRAKPVATPEDLAAMYAASPARHLHKVKAPVMLLLGAKDRRVPPPDGQQYLAALKAAGVPTRGIVFPEDSHALDRPQTEYEQWVNAAWWLREHGAGPADAAAAQSS